MLIKLPKASDCHESYVTPESFYLSRRSLLGGARAGIEASSLPRWASADEAARYADVEPGKAPNWLTEKLPGTKWQAITVKDETTTPFTDAHPHNNLSECGQGSGDPATTEG